ncbi:ABC transporter permease [Acidipropionibacterium timonense]|uniref:ABC transporter permease n=1 Tax=Acidipropionibacterium timonense TaxID=2161818 RepID=UPI001AEBC5CE|nr:ABC transporter permease [Acidipropionibacterium timonense]
MTPPDSPDHGSPDSAGGTFVHADDLTLTSRGTPVDATAMAAHQRLWGFWSITRWLLMRMRAYRWTIVGTAIGNPVLYLVAMGLGLGALVSANGQRVDGVPYIVFVAPALLISTIVMSAGEEFTYPVMEGFKWSHLYDGPVATPVSPAQIALGHHVAVMIRFLAQSAVFWLIMVAFGAAPSHWSVLTIPIALLTASSFGAPLQAYSASIETEKGQFAFVQRFVVMPMSLFAGTYYPLGVMPLWLQWIGWISPIWHGTQLARTASFGLHEPMWLTGVHVLFLVTTAAAGLWMSFRLYRRRLSR